jgi:hypothetical protein
LYQGLVRQNIADTALAAAELIFYKLLSVVPIYVDGVVKYAFLMVGGAHYELVIRRFPEAHVVAGSKTFVEMQLQVMPVVLLGFPS